MLEIWKLSFLVTVRHWRIYRKQLFSNISPTVADPLFFVLAFSYGLGSHMDFVENRAYAQFLAPGLAMTAAMFTSFFEGRGISSISLK